MHSRYGTHTLLPFLLLSEKQFSNYSLESGTWSLGTMASVVACAHVMRLLRGWLWIEWPWTGHPLSVLDFSLLRAKCQF